MEVRIIGLIVVILIIWLVLTPAGQLKIKGLVNASKSTEAGE